MHIYIAHVVHFYIAQFVLHYNWLTSESIELAVLLLSQTAAYDISHMRTCHILQSKNSLDLSLGDPHVEDDTECIAGLCWHANRASGQQSHGELQDSLVAYVESAGPPAAIRRTTGCIVIIANVIFIIITITIAIIIIAIIIVFLYRRLADASDNRCAHVCFPV